MHLLWCISPGASPLVHLPRCISLGASPPVHHLCCIDFSNASLIHPPSSYLTPLSHIIFKNIAHVGSFSHFVFVFVFVFVLVFVKCNAMTLFVYIYSLLDRILKLIYMGRLSSWMSLSLSSYLSLCVSLSVSSRGHHWIVRVMSFRNLYFMWVAMLK